MASQGDVLENPLTGEKVIFLETSEDTNGELLRFEYVLPPRFSIPEHVHPRQEERHEVLSGSSGAGWEDGSGILEKASSRSAGRAPRLA
jgi:hypothetical protein